MKNLFRRIYIKHDNNMLGGANQKRVIVSARELQYPFSQDDTVNDKLGILHYSTDLKALEDKYGSLDGFWSYLQVADDRVIIIGDREVVARLLIQYWKSLLIETSPESLHTLYLYFVRNENLINHRERMRVVEEIDINLTGKIIEPLTLEEFASIYAEVEISEALAGIPKGDVPIEYLLLSYFANTTRPLVRQITFQKVRQMVLANIARQLANARDDFFTETHNYYLLNDDGVETTIEDPLTVLQSHPGLKWAVDPEFHQQNVAVILQKYTMQDFKEIFTTYTKLFRYQFDEEIALDYLLKDDVAGLLEYDVQDEKGNYFGTEDYVIKVNGLLISYIYQLRRLRKVDELQKYQLR